MASYLPCPEAANTITFSLADITGVEPTYEDSPPGGFQAKQRLRVLSKARASAPKGEDEKKEVKLTAVMGEKAADAAGSGVFEATVNATPQSGVGFNDVKATPGPDSDVFKDTPANEPVIKAVVGFNDISDKKPESASLIL